MQIPKLEQSPTFVPAERKVQLILDAFDFPATLETVATSPIPSWEIELFGGVNTFSNPENGRVFELAIHKMKETVSGSA